MKLLRFLIIFIIILGTGLFIWLTAGNEPEALLMERMDGAHEKLLSLVLLLSVFTLLSTLAGLPVFYIALTMGFLLHLGPALLLAWTINLLSVTVTFFMVRLAFHDYFQEKIGKRKLISRINKRIQKYGLWTVVISRGIYILPTVLINYSFPLSRIRPRAYILGTAIGLVPECLINVLSGYLIKHELVLLSSPETRNWQALVVGIFILITLLTLVGLRLRQNQRKKFDKLKAVPYK